MDPCDRPETREEALSDPEAVYDADTEDEPRDMTWTPPSDPEDPDGGFGSSEEEGFGASDFDSTDSEPDARVAHLEGIVWWADSEGEDASEDGGNTDRPERRPRKASAILEDDPATVFLGDVEADGARAVRFGWDNEFALRVRGPVSSATIGRSLAVALVDVLDGIFDRDPVEGMSPETFHDAEIDLEDVDRFVRTTEHHRFFRCLEAFERSELLETLKRLRRLGVARCRVWELGAKLSERAFYRHAHRLGLTMTELSPALFAEGFCYFGGKPHGMGPGSSFAGLLSRNLASRRRPPGGDPAAIAFLETGLVASDMPDDRLPEAMERLNQLLRKRQYLDAVEALRRLKHRENHGRLLAHAS